jgi:transcriptional regulator with XRE-family HTH domain
MRRDPDESLSGAYTNSFHFRGMPNPSPLQIGAARAALRLSLAELAHLARISVPTLSKWESETSTPLPAIRDAIARVLSDRGVEFISEADREGLRSANPLNSLRRRLLALFVQEREQHRCKVLKPAPFHLGPASYETSSQIPASPNKVHAYWEERYGRLKQVLSHPPLTLFLQPRQSMRSPSAFL